MPALHQTYSTPIISARSDGMKSNNNNSTRKMPLGSTLPPPSHTPVAAPTYTDPSGNQVNVSNYKRSHYPVQSFHYPSARQRQNIIPNSILSKPGLEPPLRNSLNPLNYPDKSNGLVLESMESDPRKQGYDGQWKDWSARSVPDRNWRTSQSVIGLQQFYPEVSRTALEQRTAGLGRVECNYHESGYLFPRFERQKIRATYDDDLLKGNVVPDKKILRDIPCKLKPEAPLTPDGSARGDSCNNVDRITGNFSNSGLGRKYDGYPNSLNDTGNVDNDQPGRNSHRGSAGSSRSADSRMDLNRSPKSRSYKFSARSNPKTTGKGVVGQHINSLESGNLIRTSNSARSASSSHLNDPPLTDPNRWINQFRADPEFQYHRYSTNNHNYGSGCKDDPYNPILKREPHRGREIWYHNTRQHGCRENQLNTNHLITPMLRSARGDERWGLWAGPKLVGGGFRGVI